MSQKKVFLVVKILLLVFLVCYLVILLKDETVVNVNMKEIQHSMISEKSIASLKQHKDKSLSRYYGLTGSDYDGYLFYKSISPMAVEELLIVKVKDESQIGALEKAVKSRVNAQKSNFEGYGPKQTALLSKYILQTKGNYVFFAVSEDAAKWQEKFDQIIEGKG